MSRFWKTGGYEYEFKALRLPEFQDYREKEARYLGSIIKDGSTILDVGIGSGNSLRFLKGNVRIYGIDINNVMLGTARNSLDGKPKLTQANAENIPFSKNKFDYVICTGNTYGNFENPDECLKEMIRVVKPKGKVILGVYSEDALEVQLELYKKIGLDVESYNEEAVYGSDDFISRRFSKEKLEDIARQHVAPIEIIKLTPISYIAILRK